ncbi:MAG: elongation factor P [Candidatus Dojkabacteria bacterium]|nr:elongation factor P [Candidatus Dojkabacteria bacterium]
MHSTQLKKGAVFKDGNQVYVVLDYKHIKKGRGLAVVRIKVKNVEGGAIVEKTFSSNEKVESVDLIHRSAQFLYSDAEYCYFMDSRDYSQFQVEKENIDWQKNFLIDGGRADVLWLGEKVVGVDIPKKVSIKVKYTEPAVAGNTAGSAYKEAELETGYKIQVPLFIKIGDVVQVNTERGTYSSKE